MGIKFHCPNGHKLNVKAFLAGKRAVCPKCGQKVVVPEQSDLSIASKQASGVLNHTSPKEKSHSATAGVAPSPVAERPSLIVLPSMAARPVTEPIVPTTPPIAACQSASATVNPPVMSMETDPIAEAPTAVWYVRPPSGGQFGPAPGNIMRGWLVEGRVTSDSLVWRDGWPDWRSAASMFPQLLGISTPGPVPRGDRPVANATTLTAPISVVPATVTPVTVAPTVRPVEQVVTETSFEDALNSDYADPMVRARRHRKKGIDSTVIVSGILAALVLLLFIVLGIVISKQGGEDQPPERSKSKPKGAATTLEKPTKQTTPAESDELTNPKSMPIEDQLIPPERKQPTP